jgi:hypothetical protein
VTLFDLRLGGRTMNVRFWRDGNETKFEVLRGDPRVVVLRAIDQGLDLEADLPGEAGLAGS